MKIEIEIDGEFVEKLVRSSLIESFDLVRDMEPDDHALILALDRVIKYYSTEDQYEDFVDGIREEDPEFDDMDNSEEAEYEDSNETSEEDVNSYMENLKNMYREYYLKKVANPGEEVRTDASDDGKTHGYRYNWSTGRFDRID